LASGDTLAKVGVQSHAFRFVTIKRTVIFQVCDTFTSYLVKNATRWAARDLAKELNTFAINPVNPVSWWALSNLTFVELLVMTTLTEELIKV